MNAINPRTRKPAYTRSPKLISKACQAIEQGLSIGEAAKSIGMSHATLYRWINADPKVREQIEEAKDRLQARLLTELLSKIESSNDWRGHAWLLEKHFPERYGRASCRRCRAEAEHQAQTAGLEQIKAAMREAEGA